MDFSSLTFLFGFLPVALLLYYGAPRRMKNPVLVLASLFFYGWGYPVYLPLLVFSVLTNYAAGRALDWARDRSGLRKLLLGAGISLNFVLLAGFTWFFPLLDSIPATGLAFCFLQLTAYLLDLYRRRFDAQRNLLSFCAYAVLFPRLLTGPLTPGQNPEKALESGSLTPAALSDGIVLFICGLGKKLLLADAAGQVWTLTKAMNYGELPAVSAWIGMLSLAFWLYFTLSGYSDMAVGLGKLLGFQFPQNFDHPYAASSLRTFWRRWHITLRLWFAEYVYSPLMGSSPLMGNSLLGENKSLEESGPPEGSGKRITLYRSGVLLLTWILIGLWHGIGWNFLFWSLYSGLLLLLERAIPVPWLEKLPRFVRWLFTFLLTAVGWLFLALPSPAGLLGYLGAMIGANGAGLSNGRTLSLLLGNGVPFLVCAAASSTLPGRIAAAFEKRAPGVFQFVRTGAAIGVFCLCICFAAG